MSAARDTRRCALQALYQFDAGNTEEAAVLRSLEEAPGDADAHQRGYELAVSAWKHCKEADTELAVYAADWPTYRQPAVDRSLLRLAYYEIVHGDTPPKVAINEAVELAKEFSTEHSASFINGVLDKVYRKLRETNAIDAAGDADDHDSPEAHDDASTNAEGPTPKA